MKKKDKETPEKRDKEKKEKIKVSAVKLHLPKPFGGQTVDVTGSFYNRSLLILSTTYNFSFK